LHDENDQDHSISNYVQAGSDRTAKADRAAAVASLLLLHPLLLAGLSRQDNVCLARNGDV
jgi:hypothetical protein